MSADRAPNTLRRFFGRPNDDRGKTLAVALLVALGCGLLVSTAAVALRPIQAANIEAARARQMLAMLESVPGMSQILAASEVELWVVDLDTGTVDREIDAAGFDQAAEAADPERSTALSRSEDLAGLGRRENRALVHVLTEPDGAIALVVLPVRGTGYQSTIRAYLALEGDLSTVAAFTVYEQGETAGLGSRVAERAWQAQWPGKEIFADGSVAFDVVPSGASGPYEVDGISGATVTSYAVADMLLFWMGERGFGPFLEILKAGDTR
ncbi:NADH:ubiquinone reductase (Na(+)-transporting) subunit C [Aureimonas altamirensis]|uniref:NADH:ubiquinone reductase (Na(+)-transporting) subunit C n=1 Tax=Aureimonas altamirensis TaxID=370622 RepID=UPI001E5D42D4|nr:NADH:ubiquinone reductase (Na(+)-transporting) subunit C [Aureimonas altamirensis]UHD46472.1 NADH:ubiquinone reductase (Na(+)-transporting) subunit C [Aureimonas altamirensis]